MARTPKKTAEPERRIVYRVVFFNQGSIYEVFARHVTQGGLYGFVEIEELLFQERSQVVIDPTEDRLRHEFEGVSRFHVPLHSIVRIDELERSEAGSPRISAASPSTEGGAGAAGGGRIASFPLPFPPPRGPHKP